MQTTTLHVTAVSSRISALDSQVQTVQSQIRATTSQIAAVSSRIDAVESQVDVLHSQVAASSSVRPVTRCRLCFREIEGSDQCQRSRSSCSGWSTSPDWTSPFRDDTDGRGGGCTYQWRLECQ